MNKQTGNRVALGCILDNLEIQKRDLVMLRPMPNQASEERVFNAMISIKQAMHHLCLAIDALGEDNNG